MGNEASCNREDDDVAKVRQIRKMDARMQQKLRGGVQYNMKIVIRGSRGSGKTALWKRLQGEAFKNAYEASKSLETATINWAPRGSEEVVKVEVWDVVDSSDAEDAVIASRVDVYANAQACLFVVNPFEPDSLEYVRNERRKVPASTLVAVLLNFRDKEGSDRATLDCCRDLENCMCFETSMADCYGLGLLYEYLALPFLTLKLGVQEAQLDRTRRDLEACAATLAQATGQQSYETHKQKVQDEPPKPALESWLEDDVPDAPVVVKEEEEEEEPTNAVPDDDFYGDESFYGLKTVAVVPIFEKEEVPEKAPTVEEEVPEKAVEEELPVEPDVEPSAVEPAATAIPDTFFDDDYDEEEVPRPPQEESKGSPDEPKTRRRVVVEDEAPIEVSNAAKAAIQAAVAALAPPPTAPQPTPQPDKPKKKKKKVKDPSVEEKPKKKKKKKKVAVKKQELDPDVEAFYAEDDDE